MSAFNKSLRGAMVFNNVGVGGLDWQQVTGHTPI